MLAGAIGQRVGRAPMRRISGSIPTPSSSTVMTQSDPSSRAMISTEPPLWPAKPVPDGVLHQRLQRQERHDDVEHLRGDLQLDLQCGAEPGPFEA